MDEFDRYFSPEEFKFQTDDGETSVTDIDRIKAFFDMYGLSLDSDEYLVDQATQIRIQATDGDPIRADEVAAISTGDDGTVEVIRGGDGNIIDHVRTDSRGN